MTAVTTLADRLGDAEERVIIAENLYLEWNFKYKAVSRITMPCGTWTKNIGLSDALKTVSQIDFDELGLNENADMHQVHVQVKSRQKAAHREYDQALIEKGNVHHEIWIAATAKLRVLLEDAQKDVPNAISVEGEAAMRERLDNLIEISNMLNGFNDNNHGEE